LGWGREPFQTYLVQVVTGGGECSCSNNEEEEDTACRLTVTPPRRFVGWCRAWCMRTRDSFVSDPASLITHSVWRQWAEGTSVFWAESFGTSDPHSFLPLTMVTLLLPHSSWTAAIQSGCRDARRNQSHQRTQENVLWRRGGCGQCRG
jgi:hypothetical protein